MVARRKKASDVLTVAQKTAMAGWASSHGKLWRSELLKALKYGLYTPDGRRTFMAAGMSDNLLDALEKLGASGVKRYRTPRAYARSR